MIKPNSEKNEDPPLETLLKTNMFFFHQPSLSKNRSLTGSFSWVLSFQKDSRTQRWANGHFHSKLRIKKVEISLEDVVIRVGGFNPFEKY